VGALSYVAAMDEESKPRRIRRRGLLVAGASSAAVAGGYLAARELTDGEDDPQRRTGASGKRYVDLSTFVLAAHPPRVRAAVERHRRGLDRDTALYIREHQVALEEAARQAAADHLGARAEEVALTDSTTMGLGLVYGRLRLEPGDEVLTTEHDFYATSEALRLRRELDGVSVRVIRLYEVPDETSVDQIVGAVSRGLRPRTRAVALTWVHSSSGVKLPVREIADVVARANRGRRDHERILLCVDGVHGFGVEEASPIELGADVFVSGCHKWLFGPRGTGIVWAAPHAWERMDPVIPSFDAGAYTAWIEGRRPTEVPPGALMTPGGYHSFEHRWALPEAFEHHRELGGPAKVAATTRALAARMKKAVAEIPGMIVKTPASEELSSGLVCAVNPELPAGLIVDRLREERRVVATVTPYFAPYVRFGPSVMNTEADVDAAVEALAAVVS
jgi:selenocysteine lyase/cysteine desulfurase